MAERGDIALALDVLIETGAARAADTIFARRVLQRGIDLAHDDLPRVPAGVYISLVLTDDAGIATLNRDYRGLDQPTDVLSFPQHVRPVAAGHAPGSMPLMLGDIVISLPRAEEQARAYGHSRERELGFLLVHGLLHLLGYDHDTTAAAAAMDARQEDVLASLDLRRAAGA